MPRRAKSIKRKSTRAKSKRALKIFEAAKVSSKNKGKGNKSTQITLHKLNEDRLTKKLSPILHRRKKGKSEQNSDDDYNPEIDEREEEVEEMEEMEGREEIENNEVNEKPPTPQNNRKRKNGNKKAYRSKKRRKTNTSNNGSSNHNNIPITAEDGDGDRSNAITAEDGDGDRSNDITAEDGDGDRSNAITAEDGDGDRSNDITSPHASPHPDNIPPNLPTNDNIDDASVNLTNPSMVDDDIDRDPSNLDHDPSVNPENGIKSMAQKPKTKGKTTNRKGNGRKGIRQRRYERIDYNKDGKDYARCLKNNNKYIYSRVRQYPYIR